MVPNDKIWTEIFNKFENNNIPYENINKMVEFALSLPGTNSSTERILLDVNEIWTTEKTQLCVETLTLYCK